MNQPVQFDRWYDDFNRFAGDLYPGRYTRDFVRDLVEQAVNAFGSVDDVPCSDLAAHITAYKAKRRRDR